MLSVTLMVLPDVLAPDLNIVFCGTAAGKTSAHRGAYYAGSGNVFWPTLYKVGLTPRKLMSSEYRELLLLRMGLTDLAKQVAGNDEVLAKSHFDCGRLKDILRECQPRILAFTSKRAARQFLGRQVEYGRLPEKEGKTILFVLSSPSGAARRYWSDLPWQELSRLCREIDSKKSIGLRHD